MAWPVVADTAALPLMVIVPPSALWMALPFEPVASTVPPVTLTAPQL